MRNKVGLALSGGGVRGSYQIGAFYALKESGIKFDAIVGTSIGSFNGAMIASHHEKELLKFWQTIDMSKFLEIDPILKDKKINLSKIESILKTTSDKIKNNGFNIKPLRDELNNILKENKLRRSNINFGLVTLKSTDLKPIKIFIKDMPKGKVIEYILASCYLPIFKKEKMIDDDYYLDGGFVDNCPVQMLEELGYKKIYTIDLKALGIVKSVKRDTEIISIRPYKNLGSILTTDEALIKNNIKQGYYDALKALKKLDGIEYNIKYKNKRYYERLLRKVKKLDLKEAEEYYKTKNPKKLVIRMFEYILRNEEKDIYHIYKPRDIIKITKKQSHKSNIQYDFVRKLK